MRCDKKRRLMIGLQHHDDRLRETQHPAFKEISPQVPCWYLWGRFQLGLWLEANFPLIPLAFDWYLLIGPRTDRVPPGGTAIPSSDLKLQRPRA
jgi:hypothetical protein